MNDFEKKLQAIRLNATRHGPRLVAEALDILPQCDYAILVREVSNPAPSKLDDALTRDQYDVDEYKAAYVAALDEMQKDGKYAPDVRLAPHWIWKEILKIIEPLRSAAQGTEEFAQNLTKLFRLVEEKYCDERYFAAVVPLAQRKKAALFSHYNELRFRRLLRKLVRHSRMSNDVKNTIEARLHTRTGLFTALKALNQQAMETYDLDGGKVQLKRMDLLNAINAAMSKNLPKAASASFLFGFRHCDLCPRLVVPSENRLCRCKEHALPDKGVTTTAYQKALEVNNLQTSKHHQSLLEYLQERFVRRLRLVLPDIYPKDVACDVWWRLLEEKSERLAVCVPVNYRLSRLWKILPRTRQLVENRGGNPFDPESVLAVLNPPEPDDPPDWKERRALLNSVLTLNFAPFRLELARTEAWHTIYNKLFRAKRRGGAREGAGGARKGAGRPRKHG